MSQSTPYRPSLEETARQMGLTASDAGESERATFITKVYGLLLLTMLAAAASSAFAFTETLLPFSTWLVKHPILALGIYFGWAFGMNFVAKVPVVGALGLVGFGVFTGLWIAPMVAFYAQTNPAAITSALVGTAGIFGTMSLFGAFTKRDLSGLGSFLLPGLIVMIVLSLVNMFIFQSSLLATAVSAIVVLLFTGYVAYDTQNIMKRYPTNMPVMAAMSLYLSVFIIFINLLRLFGGRN